MQPVVNELILNLRNLLRTYMNIKIQMGACVLIHTIWTAEISELVNEALAMPTVKASQLTHADGSNQEQLGGVRPGH